MLRIASKVGISGVAMLFVLSAQQPTCNHCSATYVPSDEIQAYWQHAKQYRLVDQQARAVDIGKINLGIGVTYRGKLDGPGIIQPGDCLSAPADRTLVSGSSFAP